MEKLEKLRKLLALKKANEQREKQKSSRTYDPAADWDTDQERRPRDRGEKKKHKVREVGKGLRGQTYVYKSSSEDYSDDMEADIDQIEEEEFISAAIAEKEDEEELKFQRDEKRRRKWKSLRKDDPELRLSDVSYDADSDEDDGYWSLSNPIFNHYHSFKLNNQQTETIHN